MFCLNLAILFFLARKIQNTFVVFWDNAIGDITVHGKLM